MAYTLVYEQIYEIKQSKGTGWEFFYYREGWNFFTVAIQHLNVVHASRQHVPTLSLLFYSHIYYALVDQTKSYQLHHELCWTLRSRISSLLVPVRHSVAINVVPIEYGLDILLVQISMLKVHAPGAIRVVLWKWYIEISIYDRTLDALLLT